MKSTIVGPANDIIILQKVLSNENGMAEKIPLRVRLDFQHVPFSTSHIIMYCTHTEYICPIVVRADFFPGLHGVKYFN